MSRKQRRRQQRAEQLAKQQQSQEARLNTTMAIVTMVETEEKNDGFPFNPKGKEDQFYFDMPSVIERRMSVRRIQL